MTDTLRRDSDGEGTDPGGGPHAPDDSGAEQRKALVRLLIGLAVIAVLTVRFGVGSTVLVVLAFIAMIMLHELGHYATAKWAGMKVTEYFLGFGPRLWSVRRGETEYGVKAIPAGGYVKIIGMHNLEEVDPADEARTYRQAPFWRRLSVAVAGSVMHFLIAFVLLVATYAAVGVPALTTQVSELSAVEGGGPSPAVTAGIEVDDRIVSLDGEPVEDWEQLVSYVQARPGEPIVVGLERDGRTLSVTATPADLSQIEVEGLPADALPSEPTGFLGIRPGIDLETEPLPAALAGAAKGTVVGDLEDGGASPGIAGVTGALAQIFSPSGITEYFRNLTGASSGQFDDGGDARFLSPVGFVRIAGQAADEGLFPVLILLININLFVGVFNLVPLLPLDGGHVVIAVYEKIRSVIARRRYHADVAKLMPLTYAVFLVIVFIGLSSLYLDVVNPIANPFGGE